MEESIVSFKAKGNELILVMREEDDFDRDTGKPRAGSLIHQEGFSGAQASM